MRSEVTAEVLERKCRRGHAQSPENVYFLASAGRTFCRVCRKIRMDATKDSPHWLQNSNPLYFIWKAMRQRCGNATSREYSNYGGRGVRVCDRWSVFENFVADMGPRPEGASLDRIDNNGNYEPGNCRWATQALQSRNTRRTRMISHLGATMCIADWARLAGLNSGAVLSSRVKKLGELRAMQSLNITSAQLEPPHD